MASRLEYPRQWLCITDSTVGGNSVTKSIRKSASFMTNVFLNKLGHSLIVRKKNYVLIFFGSEVIQNSRKTV